MTIRGTNGYFGRAAFTAYLKQLPPEEVVGERGLPTTCPISEFIKHVAPEVSSVKTGRHIITLGNAAYQTPNWAAHFIDDIDDRALRDRYVTGQHVTAAEALACLKQ